MILGPTDLGLLDALGRYRLLTIPQAVRLGIATAGHVGERLCLLERHGLIGMLNQSRAFGPRVHWLKKAGAEEATAIAAERGEALTIKAPKKGYVKGPQLWQRIAIVDCHVALRMWLEATRGSVERFHFEFEANPLGRREKALKFEWQHPDGTPAEYPPDGAGIITLADRSRWLFALEVETGGEALRGDNFSRMLDDRLAAFDDAALERGWNWPKGGAAPRARLLFVFPDDKMADAARKRLAKSTSPSVARTYIKTVPQILQSFAGGWMNVRGEIASPFVANITSHEPPTSRAPSGPPNWSSGAPRRR